MKKKASKILSLCLALAMTAGMATTALAEDVEISGPKYIIPNVTDTISRPVSKESDWKATMTFKDGKANVYTVPLNTSINLENMSSYNVASVVLVDGVLTLKEVEPKSAYTVSFECFTTGDGFSFAEAGSNITFVEEGIYFLDAFSLAGSANICIFLDVKDETSNTATPPVENTPNVPVSSQITATPTSSKVLVNGAVTAFEAYTIDGNNYFKLRDVAKVVSGSGKQFEVTWNTANSAIELVSGKAYTVVGGELAAGDGTAKNAVDCTSAIYKDGAVVSLKAYTINGNNYFKLRDLGQAFDFGVAWDGANNAVTIDTAKGYSAD